MASKPRKARAPAPANETKEMKFVRLGKARMDKALKGIRLIGNLSGSGYSYNAEQIEKMEQALHSAVEATMERFSTQDKATANGFSF